MKWWDIPSVPPTPSPIFWGPWYHSGSWEPETEKQPNVVSSKRKWMLWEDCEFKSRTLELEEITVNSRLMRRRILLRAYFLGLQDDKDPNRHWASPVMPISCMLSEPALTSCLNSPPTKACPDPQPSLPVWTHLQPRHAQHPWAFSCFWRPASHPGALLKWPPRAELLSLIPHQESQAHSLQLLSLSRDRLVWSPSLAVASCYWSSEHPELFLPNSYHYFSYTLVRLFN